MKWLKFSLILLLLASVTNIYAEQSLLEKTQQGASSLWEKTKQTSAQLAEQASEKAAEFSEKAGETGSKAAKEAKQTGERVWEKTKEVSKSAISATEKGIQRLRNQQDECQQDSALCFENKE